MEEKFDIMIAFLGIKSRNVAANFGRFKIPFECFNDLFQRLFDRINQDRFEENELRFSEALIGKMKLSIYHNS